MLTYYCQHSVSHKSVTWCILHSRAIRKSVPTSESITNSDWCLLICNYRFTLLCKFIKIIYILKVHTLKVTVKIDFYRICKKSSCGSLNYQTAKQLLCKILFWSSKLEPQNFKFIFCYLKTKFFWESINIPFNRFIYIFSFIK